MSDLVNSEYVKFKVDMIPPRILQYYKLNNLIHDRYVYAKINTWYRQKQLGKIAQDDLVKHLQQHEYVQAKHTYGYFTHNIRDISFTLVVDNFDIKYTNKQYRGHLIKIMQLKYKFKVNFEVK